MEGLAPAYQVGGTTYKTGMSAPDVVAEADGYRLPSQVEWEWAARGGVATHGYIYSGSSDINAVGWHTDNSGGASKDLYASKGTWPVGKKQANELEIYDMSGNVLEWCFVDVSTIGRCLGGSWYQSSNLCLVVGQSDYNPSALSFNYIGFRVARPPKVVAEKNIAGEI